MGKIARAGAGYTGGVYRAGGIGGMPARQRGIIGPGKRAGGSKRIEILNIAAGQQLRVNRDARTGGRQTG